MAGLYLYLGCLIVLLTTTLHDASSVRYIFKYSIHLKHIWLIFRPYCRHLGRKTSRTLHGSTKACSLPLVAYSGTILTCHSKFLRLSPLLPCSVRSYSILRLRIPRDVTRGTSRHRYFVPSRMMLRPMSTGMVMRIVGRLVKLRYLVLTSAVAGGVSLHNVSFGKTFGKTNVLHFTYMDMYT